MLKQIKKFAYEQKTQTYTIMVKSDDVYKVTFPDEDLDEVFDRIFTNKFKNWANLKTKNDYEYCHLLLQYMIEKLNPKKKEQIVVNEYICSTGNCRPVFENLIFNGIKFWLDDLIDTVYEKRVWFGVIKMTQKNFPSTVNEVNDEVASNFRDIFCIFCTSKQLINFEQVTFPNVPQIFKNVTKNLELPEWMETDMIYIFPLSNNAIISGKNTQYPYRCVLPLQYPN